jgi:lysozyme
MMAGKDKDNPKLALERKKKSPKASASNTKAKPVKPAPVKPIPPTPLTGVACVNGIDFSSWSGKVDFQAIKDNPQIAFFGFRASIGYTRDPRFVENLAGAWTTGKPFFVYHFWYPQRDTKRQVDLICSLAKDTPWPYWFDAEANGGMDKNHCGNQSEKFVKFSEDRYEMRPTIYTNLNFWDYLMPRTNWAKYYDLAMAAWSNTAILPMLPQDWITKQSPLTQQRREKWLFWQWNKAGRVPGINASVDLNRMPVEKFVKLMAGAA